MSRLELQTPPVEGAPGVKHSPELSPTIEAVLVELINGLIHLSGDRFIILENYHRIQDEEIHRMIAYLIDYLPPNFHLIITSQVSPPLQIPRLRVRRELLEIGPENLP